MNKHIKLFNRIAKIYGLFYKTQTIEYQNIFSKYLDNLNLKDNCSILDIGCGSGAVAGILSTYGYKVTAIDGSEKMIAVAKRKNQNYNIDFQVGDIEKGLNFADKSFDLVMCAYVAHGLSPQIRKKLYLEGKRLSKTNFLIQDFNNKFNPFISIIEFFEGGDYFNFKKNGYNEMSAFFDTVKTIPVSSKLNWYICT